MRGGGAEEACAFLFTRAHDSCKPVTATAVPHAQERREGREGRGEGSERGGKGERRGRRREEKKKREGERREEKAPPGRSPGG